MPALIIEAPRTGVALISTPFSRSHCAKPHLFMDLKAAVDGFFAPSGPLSDTMAAYQPREGQIRMAGHIAQTMEAGGALAIEAGTGVGKTYAYLVPALLSGERVLVSTATKALQEQLYHRDIPRLAALCGSPVRVALLKGRSSYLCLQRLENARLEAPELQPRALQTLLRIAQWAQATRAGDLAEVDGLDEDSPLVSLVTSTRENCLGSRCPRVQDCRVNLARRQAMEADVVVVNHHLFFADLQVRESGVAELLPRVRTVVFDEAHQLNDVGIRFLGLQWSTGQMDTFASDLLTLSQRHGLGRSDWEPLAATVLQATRLLHSTLEPTLVPQRMEWLDAAPQGVQALPWQDCMTRATSAVLACKYALESVMESHPELQMLRDRSERLVSALEQFSAPVTLGQVRWLEVDTQIRLVQSPLNIADAMQSRVLFGEGAAGQQKSWIFTSATLGHGADMGWFLESCGLQGAEVAQVPSPFDYPSQAALFVPDDFPAPDDPRHSARVAALALRGARRLGGRTLVLTTTLRAMHGIAQALAPDCQGAGGLALLVQGQMPKREMLERFTAGTPSESGGYLMVASMSFWEGIDIPGEALQFLVVDKIPFSPPHDPLVQAKERQLKAQGKNSFKHLALPQAAVTLRQGAGRLIRSESDRGVLAVCDVRLVRAGYGRQLLKALPEMRRLPDYAALDQALAWLTRPSTKDPILSATP